MKATEEETTHAKAWRLFRFADQQVSDLKWKQRQKPSDVYRGAEFAYKTMRQKIRKEFLYKHDK